MSSATRSSRKSDAPSRSARRRRARSSWRSKMMGLCGHAASFMCARRMRARGHVPRDGGIECADDALTADPHRRKASERGIARERAHRAASVAAWRSDARAPATAPTRLRRIAGALRATFGLARRRRAAAALRRLPRAGRRRRRCAPPAGRSCRSSRRPIASGSASRSPTIPAPASCRWRRSPIRRPITAPAPRCATTTSRARWCMRSNTATGSTSRPPWAAGWRTPGATLLRRGRRAGAGAAALAAAVGAAVQPVGAAGRGHRARRRPACRSRYRALKRVKATPQQVGLSQSARAQNVQGAFRVPPDGKAAVAGRRLILVDDVLTSGATVDACARALLRAGAAQVDALVFARVVAGARNPI